MGFIRDADFPFKYDESKSKQLLGVFDSVHAWFGASAPSILISLKSMSRHSIHVAKSDLQLPDPLAPGTYKFESATGTLRMRVAFDQYGREYVLSEDDIAQLEMAHNLQLEYDDEVRRWRFAWGPNLDPATHQ